MRAIWVRQFGGPEVLTPGTAPDPVAGPGQVVIDVEYVNVTFVETQLRAGGGPFTPTLPTIPGNGVGGTLPDGTRVVSSTGGSGAYAERVAVPEESVFRVPDNLPMDTAVALLADGRTATMLTRTAALKPGDRVLVEAAAGGVGSLLVQLATAAGAHVIAAAGGPRKTAVAKDLGAATAIDYLDETWPEQAGDVDVVFDGVGGDIARTAFSLLRRGGRMLTYGLASGSWSDIDDETATGHAVTLIRPQPTPAELRAYTENALAEAVAGRLRPIIGQRFPLDQAAQAHAAIESRATIGKTLLETRPDSYG